MPPKDDFQEDFPQPGQAPASRDDFQENWTGKSDLVKEATPEQPGLAKRAFEFVGGWPGIGGAGASLIAAALAPETGGLSLAIPALAGGATAAGITAAQGKPDPLLTGATTALGDIGGGLVGKGLGWAGGKVASKFELGKYVGDVGKKLGEVLQTGPLKTTQDIYNALHLGQAEKMLSRTYQDAQDLITRAVGPSTQLTGPVAKRLNTLFSNHLPEVKELLELRAMANPATPVPGPLMRPGAMTQAQIAQRTIGGAASPLDEPINIGDAMEWARLMGDKAARSRKGGGGFATREANREVRRGISQLLDQAVPGKGLGQVYSDANFKYAQGRTALSAFEDTAERQLFKKSTKGPTFDRVEWQKASEEALRRLKDVGLEDLDAVIRYGQPPGYVGTKIGGHVRTGLPIGRSLFHPGTWINLEMENPLRPPGGKISPELLRKIFQGAGANIGAQFGE